MVDDRHTGELFPDIKEIRAAAARYAQEGYDVHRINPDKDTGMPTKAPTYGSDKRRTSWKYVTHEPHDFRPGDNIGAKLGALSGNIVVADMDSPESILMACRILPPTRTIGHHNEPTHYHYRSEVPKKVEWNLRGEGKFVELLTNGQQVVMPPSVWLTKEGDNRQSDYYRMIDDLTILDIAQEELIRKLNLVAGAAYIYKYLPPEGVDMRHRLSLYIAGMLAHYDYPQEDAETLLGTVWQEACGNVNALMNNIRTTYEKDRPEREGKLRELERDEDTPTKYALPKGFTKNLAKLLDIALERDRGGSRGSRQPSKAKRLIEYGLETAEELFTDQYGLPFAKVEGKPVALDSGAYTWLRNEMYDREGESCSREQLSEAVGTLAARAARGGARELHVRAAHVGETVYVELAPGVVWEIDALGHRRSHNPPVLFRQDPNVKPLPTPEKGGNLEDLKRFVRLKTDRDFRLYAADLVTALVSDIARPIQNPTGTFGAGKTTLGRITKRLVDPRKPETLQPNKEGFFQNVHKAFVVLVDNEGSLTPELSDTFCRLVTGEGDAARKLYTDDDSIVREKIVKLAINGINASSASGDFMDRALPFELERIPKMERIAERRLWKEFEAAKPKLLGAVFDALSGGLAEYGPLQDPPRLADWAEYAAAVYEGLGWGRKQFLDDWAVIEETQHSTTLEGSPVAAAVLKFMEDRDYYEGSAGDLLDNLKDIAEDMGLNPRNNKAFPQASNWVWKKIQPVKPTLEGFGIRADQEPRGRGSDKRKVVVLDKRGGVGNPPGGASKNSDADPTDSAQESEESRGGGSGVSRASKNPPPYDVGVNSDSGGDAAGGCSDTIRYRENADPANPASPKAYQSQKSGGSKTDVTDPTSENTDPTAGVSTSTAEAAGAIAIDLETYAAEGDDARDPFKNVVRLVTYCEAGEDP